MNRCHRAFVAIGVLAIVACGCGSSADSGAGSAAASAAPADKPEEMTPTDLGNRVAELYVEALTELGDAMADRPAAADLQPSVEALKDRYVAQLIELGKQRVALSDADKAKVNGRVLVGMNTMPSEVFSDYAEGQRHYQESGDMDLAKLIGEFNILTQYADFELLKKQAPMEAERLGID